MRTYQDRFSSIKVEELGETQELRAKSIDLKTKFIKWTTAITEWIF